AVLLYLVQNPAWWRFQEALRPDQSGGSPFCLLDDPRVRADLAAPQWTLEPRGVLIDSSDFGGSGTGFSWRRRHADWISTMNPSNDFGRRRLHSCDSL